MPETVTISVSRPPVPAPEPSSVRRLLTAIDAGDILVAGGLLLWALAFWPDLRLALGVPGLVLVWYGLPPRPGFFLHGAPPKR